MAGVNLLSVQDEHAIRSVERVGRALAQADLNDLCDSTDAAIKAGGGFGWVSLPAREILERYWQGVIAMPARMLYVARLDGIICGTCQLIRPPSNNEAQAHAVQLSSLFVSPWARGHGLSRMLLQRAEEEAAKAGFSVINLDVRESAQAAISLYESTGYELLGLHPYYALIDGQYVGGRYYTKKLGA